MSLSFQIRFIERSYEKRIWRGFRRSVLKIKYSEEKLRQRTRKTWVLRNTRCKERSTIDTAAVYARSRNCCSASSCFVLDRYIRPSTYFLIRLWSLQRKGIDLSPGFSPPLSSSVPGQSRIVWWKSPLSTRRLRTANIRPRAIDQAQWKIYGRTREWRGVCRDFRVLAILSWV